MLELLAAFRLLKQRAPHHIDGSFVRLSSCRAFGRGPRARFNSGCHSESSSGLE